MSTPLQEFTAASAAHLRVDRDAGVLRSVKLLGLTSTNGRRYLESALREAMPLYEGAKVNVNHAKGGPLGPREYQDRLGVIRSVTFRDGEGLFGDLHYNPKHALAEQLVWDAEHAPQNVGLSHNVLAHMLSRTGSPRNTNGDAVVVERIEKVQSIDVVADPATTRGLFEAVEPAPHERDCEPVAEGASPPQETREQPAQPSPDATDPTDHAARARLICELLHEHGLPLPGNQSAAAQRIVSEEFFDALWKVASDASVRQLVEDRAALVEAARTWRNPPAYAAEAASFGRVPGTAPPTSRDQFAAALGVPVVHEPDSAKAFVEAIKA